MTASTMSAGSDEGQPRALTSSAGAQLAVEHGRNAAVDGRDDPPGQLATEVGGVDALAAQQLGAERARDRGVVRA